LLLLFSGFAGIHFARAQDKESGVNIIPMPQSITTGKGQFIINLHTTITGNAAASAEAGFLREGIRTTTGITLPKNGALSASTIVLTTDNTTGLPAEGYRLTVTPAKVTIAGKGSGLFYGIQTLVQLLAGAGKSHAIACVTIVDQPRFAYRGFMLDVSRHFFSAAYVKQVLDWMAAYKLNKFHWHLVDSEGWRIEIKKYPKLTEVAAFREQVTIGRNRDGLDSIPYGGYYTQEEIRDVVKYATARHIDVIPEIEMPAHSMAVLRAYPELKCEAPPKGVSPNPYNILFSPSEQTFTFLENVLTEVLTLFPGKYIHIGGDEANKQPWKTSALAQQVIKDQGLKNEEELQSYFIRRMEKFLNAKGRAIIGWDEILEGGLAPNATVMSWRGEEGGIASAKQGHNVVMSPAPKGMYLDFYQSYSLREPINIGGYAPLSLTYGYDPVPASLTEAEKKYVIGVQGNMWTEYVVTPAKQEYMLFPRFYALAEVAWAQPARKDFKDFSERRIPAHLARLDATGFHYRVPETIGAPDTVLIGQHFTFTLQPSVPGAKVYYTINGLDPDETDREYTVPVEFKIPVNQTRELKTVVITPSGKRSTPTYTVMHNRPMTAGIAPTIKGDGLKYKLYTVDISACQQMLYAPAADSGISNSISTDSFRNKNRYYGLSFEGYLKIDNPDTYSFSIASDDGSQLYIDNQLVVDNNKNFYHFPVKGAVSLDKGYHRIKVYYYNNTWSSYLYLNMYKGNAVQAPQALQLSY
jgi:hexosaminidase